MFKIQAKDLGLFKNAITILKTDVVSVRAQGSAALLSLVNRNTGLMLLHKVRAEVEARDAPEQFGINSDRLVALLSKDELELDFNGSSLSYKSGRSRGTLETHDPYFEAWPDIKQTGTPVQEVLNELSFLNLKGENIYLFGGQYGDQPAVACGDREHFVFMPLQKVSPFTLPLSALNSAQRIFRDGVKATVDAGIVYFQARTERSMSLLRFGPLGDLDVLSLEAFGKLKSLGNLWSAQVDSQVFKNILADYKAIEDAERTGLLTLEIKSKVLSLTCKTRHGSVSLEDKAQGDDCKPVTLNVDLLKDIMRLEGMVTIALKNNERVFTIYNDKCLYGSGLGSQ